MKITESVSQYKTGCHNLLRTRTVLTVLGSSRRHCHVNVFSCGNIDLGIFPRDPCYVLVREYDVCNLGTRTCPELVKISLSLVFLSFCAHLLHIEFHLFSQSSLRRIFGNGCLTESKSVSAPVVLIVSVLVFVTLISEWVAR